MVNKHCKIQSFPSQMVLKDTDKYTQFNSSEFDYSVPSTGKHIQVNLQNALTNRTIPSKLK